MPVPLAIANRPPAESSNEYEIVLFVASASEAEAVMPTAVPLAEFSANELAVALVSVTDPTSNSSTSVRLIVNTCVEKLPSLDVARTVTLCEVADS